MRVNAAAAIAQRMLTMADNPMHKRVATAAAAASPIEHDDGQIQPAMGRITKRMDNALHEYVLNGGNQADAAQKAGVTASALSKALKREHVQSRVRDLLTRHKLYLGTKALRTLEQCMDAESGYVRVQAASKVADITGHSGKDTDAGERVLIVNITI